MTQKEVLAVITEYERIRSGESGQVLVASAKGNKAYLSMQAREVYNRLKK
jgi:hypothetical protein